MKTLLTGLIIIVSMPQYRVMLQQILENPRKRCLMLKMTQTNRELILFEFLSLVHHTSHNSLMSWWKKLTHAQSCACFLNNEVRLIYRDKSNLWSKIKHTFLSSSSQTLLTTFNNSARGKQSEYMASSNMTLSLDLWPWISFEKEEGSSASTRSDTVPPGTQETEHRQVHKAGGWMDRKSEADGRGHCVIGRPQSSAGWPWCAAAWRHSRCKQPCQPPRSAGNLRRSQGWTDRAGGRAAKIMKTSSNFNLQL